MVTNTDEDDSGYVAVVAMSGRFPGAPTVAEFWQNLLAGREGITRLGLDDPELLPAYGVLAGADEFDAEFFGYSDDEAAIIDPQQRLLLECAHEALEKAGYPDAVRPSTGVFVGGATTEHAAQIRVRRPGVSESRIRLGNDLDYLSTRIAYKLGLSGPALTVLTACSSSLVAVHLAIQSLLAGDCDLAIAGGASVQAEAPRVRYDPEASSRAPAGAARSTPRPTGRSGPAGSVSSYCGRSPTRWTTETTCTRSFAVPR